MGSASATANNRKNSLIYENIFFSFGKHIYSISSVADPYGILLILSLAKKNNSNGEKLSLFRTSFLIVLNIVKFLTLPL